MDDLFKISQHLHTAADEAHTHRISEVVGLQHSIENPNIIVCDETEVVAPLSIAGILTIDLAQGTVFRPLVPLNRSIVVSIINPPPPGEIAAATIYFTQDAVGGHGVTWPANVDFGGVPPALSGANGTDMISLITRDGGGIYYGEMTGKGFGIAPPPPPVTDIPTYELTIGSVAYDVNLKAYFQQNTAWDGIADADFKLTVLPGAAIGATTTANTALVVTEFPSNSNITITNNGFIVGAGGDGGASRAGYPGGPAFYTDRPITITNNGVIGGGGGGGAGSPTTPGAIGGGGAGMKPGNDIKPGGKGTLTAGGLAVRTSREAAQKWGGGFTIPSGGNRTGTFGKGGIVNEPNAGHNNTSSRSVDANGTPIVRTSGRWYIGFTPSNRFMVWLKSGDNIEGIHGTSTASVQYACMPSSWYYRAAGLDWYYYPDPKVGTYRRGIDYLWSVLDLDRGYVEFYDPAGTFLYEQAIAGWTAGAAYTAAINTFDYAVSIYLGENSRVYYNAEDNSPVPLTGYLDVLSADGGALGKPGVSNASYGGGTAGIAVSGNSKINWLVQGTVLGTIVD